MASQRSGPFWGGVLLGTAVGTVAGLISAPCSGRKTRQILKKTVNALPELAEDLSASLQLQADRWSIHAFRQWDVTLERLREALEAGVEAANAQQQAIRTDKIRDKTS